MTGLNAKQIEDRAIRTQQAAGRAWQAIHDGRTMGYSAERIAQLHADYDAAYALQVEAYEAYKASVEAA